MIQKKTHARMINVLSNQSLEKKRERYEVEHTLQQLNEEQQKLHKKRDQEWELVSENTDLTFLWKEFISHLNHEEAQIKKRIDKCQQDLLKKQEEINQLYRQIKPHHIGYDKKTSEQQEREKKSEELKLDDIRSRHTKI